MTLADSVTLDLLNVIADAPLTFTWSGTTYTDAGTRGALVRRNRFGDGGFLEEPELTVTTTLQKLNGVGALIDRFPANTPPAHGEIIEVDDVNYRITAVHKDEFNSGLQLDCASTSRGAQ